MSKQLVVDQRDVELATKIFQDGKWETMEITQPEPQIFSVPLTGNVARQNAGIDGLADFFNDMGISFREDFDNQTEIEENPFDKLDRLRRATILKEMTDSLNARMEGNKAKILNVEVEIQHLRGLYFCLGYLENNNQMMNTVYLMRVYQPMWGGPIWEDSNVLESKHYTMQNVIERCHQYIANLEIKLAKILTQ